MPFIQIDLSEEDFARVSAVAAAEKRAKKNQAAICLMERIAQIEAAEAETKEIP